MQQSWGLLLARVALLSTSAFLLQPLVGTTKMWRRQGLWVRCMDEGAVTEESSGDILGGAASGIPVSCVGCFCQLWANTQVCPALCQVPRETCSPVCLREQCQAGLD